MLDLAAVHSSNANSAERSERAKQLLEQYATSTNAQTRAQIQSTNAALQAVNAEVGSPTLTTETAFYARVSSALKDGAKLRDILATGANTQPPETNLDIGIAELEYILEGLPDADLQAQSARPHLETLLEFAQNAKLEVVPSWKNHVSLPTLATLTSSPDLTQLGAAQRLKFAAQQTQTLTPSQAPITATVNPFETIIHLASRTLGDPQLWANIVRWNQLDPPFIVPVAAPYRAQGLRVLEPSDPVKISALPDPGTVIDVEAEIYGIDLAWDERTYQLKLNAARDNLSLSRGLENLRLALTRRSITPFGNLPAHPNYGNGIFRFIGESTDFVNAKLAALEQQICLQSDDRVKNTVISATNTTNTDKLELAVTVEPAPPAEAFNLRSQVNL